MIILFFYFKFDLWWIVFLSSWKYCLPTNLLHDKRSRIHTDLVLNSTDDRYEKKSAILLCVSFSSVDYSNISQAATYWHVFIAVSLFIEILQNYVNDFVLFSPAVKQRFLSCTFVIMFYLHFYECVITATNCKLISWPSRWSHYNGTRNLNVTVIRLFKYIGLMHIYIII